MLEVGKRSIMKRLDLSALGSLYLWTVNFAGVSQFFSGTGWYSGLEVGFSFFPYGRLELTGAGYFPSSRSLRVSLYPSRLSSN